MANRELFDFLNQSSVAMQNEYERIGKRSVEDPGTAGDEGEDNWRELLSKWLTETYRVVTKGRVIFHNGDASPQMDLLVLNPEYPKGLVEAGRKLYLAGGVLAAFECKLTIRQEDITKAFQNSRTLSERLPRRWGSPYRELQRPIVYGLLAHSHEWKSPLSQPAANVSKGLSAQLKAPEHPRELLDLICVSDLGTWTSTKHFSQGHYEFDEQGSTVGRSAIRRLVYAGYALHDTSEQLATQVQLTNVAAMVVDVLTRISRERLELRSIASNFRSVTSLAGDARGHARTWNSGDVFSRTVQEELARRDLHPPANICVIRDEDQGVWSEWQGNFGTR
jgi:hypothetical protein